jgi:osmoprotectant transport system ATP-binding protein
VIVLEDVSRAYGERLAVAGVSLSVARGECVFLVGASGSGKTTTLKMVNRLIEPSAGRILLDGSDVREGPAHRLRRRVGYAFQGAGLFPHMTVAENVAVTPELLGWPRPRIDARVEALLELVELPPAEYRGRWPHELSGGQQQRVRWPPSPRSCCWTSPSAPSIRSPAIASSSPSAGCAARWASPSSS